MSVLQGDNHKKYLTDKVSWLCPHALLLRGSFNAYFTPMIKAYLFYKSGEKFNRAFRLGRTAYMTFLKRAYQMMEVNPLNHDDTPDQVLIKIKREDSE